MKQARGWNNPNTITITLPKTGRPEVDRPWAQFPKDRKSFRFVFPGNANARVIFKTATPIDDGRFILDKGVNGQDLPLKKNTGEKPKEYYYMVVDLDDPKRPPYDPVIVIDPQ